LGGKKISIQNLDEPEEALGSLRRDFKAREGKSVHMNKSGVNNERNKNKINSMFAKPKISHHNKQYSSSVLTSSSLNKKVNEKKPVDQSQDLNCSQSLCTP